MSRTSQGQGYGYATTTSDWVRSTQVSGFGVTQVPCSFKTEAKCQYYKNENKKYGANKPYYDKSKARSTSMYNPIISHPTNTNNTNTNNTG